MNNKLGTYWITEERDYYLDQIVYSKSHNTYEEAYADLLERKANSMNEFEVRKVERSLLVE